MLKSASNDVLEIVDEIEKHLPMRHNQKKHGRSNFGLKKRSALVNKIRNLALQENVLEASLKMKDELGLQKHDLQNVYVKDIPIILEVIALMPKSDAEVTWRSFSKEDMQQYLTDVAADEGFDENVYAKAAGATTPRYDGGYDIAIHTLNDTEYFSGLMVRQTSAAFGPYQVMRSVVAHEYAHILDDAGEGLRLSESKIFQTAFYAAKLKRKFPSLYGTDDAREMFCEVAAAMVIEPTRTMRGYPDLYNAVSSLLKWDPIEGIQ